MTNINIYEMTFNFVRIAVENVKIIKFTIKN